MMRHLVPRLGLLALAAVVSLPGCGRSSPDRSGRGSSPKSAAVHKVSANASTNTSPLATGDNERHPTEVPAWLTAARNDADPSARLQAIEDWARDPGETLDPVTYALVDPDESVRVRAEELWEEALARR